MQTVQQIYQEQLRVAVAALQREFNVAAFEAILMLPLEVQEEASAVIFYN
jgi:hypothetical protein